MANVVDVHVGRQIELRCRELGLSDGQVATQLGITVEELRRHQAGERRIQPARLFQLAAILSVSLHWFFESLSRDMPSFDDDGAEPASDEARLLTLFSSITDPNQRAEVIGFLERLVARPRRSEGSTK